MNTKNYNLLDKASELLQAVKNSRDEGFKIEIDDTIREMMSIVPFSDELKIFEFDEAIMPITLSDLIDDVEDDDSYFFDRIGVDIMCRRFIISQYKDDDIKLLSDIAKDTLKKFNTAVSDWANEVIKKLQNNKEDKK